VLGQGEGLLEVVQGLVVAAHPGADSAEVPVGQGLGGRLTEVVGGDQPRSPGGELVAEVSPPSVEGV
jgi:hypothetical protein